MRDVATIRQESRAVAAGLGYEVTVELPLLDAGSRVRSSEELVQRCLTLHALIAVSYGFPRQSARVWLEQEELMGAISPREALFLGVGSPEEDDVFRGFVESVWALLWTLGVASELDFAHRCPDDMVTLLPDLMVDESSSSFRTKASPRSTEEVVVVADLAYCLHWADKDAVLRGGARSGQLPSWVLEERRRALDWALSQEDWDDITLDT